MRPPRIDIAGYPYHIITRGNNKQILFRDDDDRLCYLGILAKAWKKFGFNFHTYSLMDNHIHLLLTIKENFYLAGLMHWVQLGYARYFNGRYKQVGHVFQARYHAIVIEKDAYLLNVDRYIQLNAVRAGIVAKPEDYRWSSYRDCLSPAKNSYLEHATVLNYFGSSNETRIAAYREFVDSAIRKPEEWSIDLLMKMNVLGSPGFSRAIYNHSITK